jgi:hypothetical protein
MARAEEIALKLLQQEGVAGIWELQMRAAAVHREGERDAAEALIEIADAAEEILRQRVRQDAAPPPA